MSRNEIVCILCSAWLATACDLTALVDQAIKKHPELIPDGELVVTPGLDIPIGAQQQLSAKGGLGPYAFSIIKGAGTIDPGKGLYTAGFFPGEATVQVTDRLRQIVTTTFKVTMPGGGLLWLKADTIEGLTDGVRVSDWLDSFLAAHATQSSEDACPVLTEGAINGLPSVRFDGARSALFVGPLDVSTAHSLYFVERLNAELFSENAIVAGFFDAAEFHYVAGTSEARFSHGIVQGQWNIISVIRSEQTVSMFKNGARVGDPQQLAANERLTLNMIGNSVDGAQPYNGDLPELLVFDSAHDDKTRHAIEYYLAYKYHLYVP